jgi:serine/threonine protein phosphatase 1
MARQWVIPDIHGYSKTLRALIEDKIKPSHTDTVYFLGDYIDRGPDSKGVIDFIIGLQKDKYNIRTLRGNHEDYLLRTYNNENTRHILGITYKNTLKKEWFKYGGKATLESFAVNDVHEIPSQYINWMNGLEYHIILDDFILVHAGFNFEIEDPYADQSAMMWIKDFKVDPEKIGNRKIIHGHVPVSLDFISFKKSKKVSNFIDLDNGIYMPEKQGFGNLVALELSTMELQVQSNLDIG